MTVGGIAEICVCGHAKETHFLDHERPGEYQPGQAPKMFWGACLGMHCDHCTKYTPRPEPKDR